MSGTIDQRVVQMGFDNAQFEKGVKTSLDTLGDLKKGLNFGDSIKSLLGLSDAGKNFSLGNISDGVQTIASRFTTLGIIGVTALMNITNAAINAGTAIVKSLTIDPIKGGFAEYEAGLKAFQTISANTKSAGSTIDDINKALFTLNDYANRTIYSFGDMTKGIGLFTAQGVTLKDSLTGIKGIYNIVSLTGGDADKANGAIYQLSQSIASGTVRAQDWISVVNAGIGGTDFQNQLIQTAKVHNVNVDAMIKKEGSFRASLASNWLTSDILLETLSQYTGDITAEQLKSLGYSEKQIAQIQELGARANDSATKIKSYTQLMDTLTSNVVTSWATSFKIVIGDLDKASTLWTEVGNSLGGILQSSNDSRNALLNGWADLGGRADLVQALRNAFDGVMSIVKPLGDAFKEIFPPVTAQMLKNFTQGLVDLTAKFKMGAKPTEDLKRIFKAVFAILDIGRMAILALANGLGKFSKAIAPASGNLLDLVLRFADFIVKVRDSIKSSDTFNKIVEKIAEILTSVGTGLMAFVNFIVDGFNKLKELSATNGFLSGLLEGFKTFIAFFQNIDMGPVNDFIAKFKERFAPLAKIGEILGTLFTKISEALAPIKATLKKVQTAVGTALGNLLDTILKWVQNVDFTKINFKGFFDGLNAGLLSALIFSITGFVNKGSGLFSGILGVFKDVKGFSDSADGILKGITSVLDGVKSSLQSWQQSLRADMLLKIAGAIGILSISLIALSMVDSAKLTMALGGITVLFIDLFGAMAGYEKVAGSSGGASLVKGVIGMIGMSVAVLLLAGALTMIAKLNPDQVTQGVLSIAVLTGVLIATAKVMEENSSDMLKGALGMIVFSLALRSMIGPVKKLGEMDQGALTKGLIGIGVLLAELAIFMKVSDLNDMGIKNAFGLLIFAGAVGIMSIAVEKFANMESGKISQGLLVLALILTELTAFTKLTSGSTGMVSMALSMVILGGAMLILGEAIKRMGDLSWDQIAKGLTSMAGALAIIALAMTYMPPNMLVTALSLVVVAGALVIMANALTTMGAMSWDQVAKGLVLLGGSLLVIALALNAMTSALPGSAALLVAALALMMIAVPLKILGAMSLEAIGLSLLALVGVFTVLGVAGLALTEVVPILFALGAAMLLIGLAALAVGVGLLAFSTGLATLAVSGAAGGTALTLIIMSIVGLLPMMGTALAQAMITFAQKIKEGTPIIVDAISTVIMALIQTVVDNNFAFNQAAVDLLIGFMTGIRDNIFQITTLAWDIVTNFLDAVSLKIPDLVNSGYTLLIAWVNGMTLAATEYMPTLVISVRELGIAIVKGVVQGLLDSRQELWQAMLDLGSMVLTSFAESLGIHSPSLEFTNLGIAIVQGLIDGIVGMVANVVLEMMSLGRQVLNILQMSIPEFLTTGRSLIISLISGMEELKSAIIDRMLSMANSAILTLQNKYEEFKTIGKNFIQGMADGIANYGYVAVAKAQNVAQTVIDAIKTLLGIHSPSTVTTSFGMFVVKGLANGILKYANLVADASKTVATSALSGLGNIISQIADSVNSEITMQPVITPVIDLSNIQNSGKELDKMFGAKSINVSGTVDKLSAISTNVQQSKDVLPVTKEAVRPASISLVQNNYSPVALSRLDIYRQTKNQFTTLKGIVGEK